MMRSSGWSFALHTLKPLLTQRVCVPLISATRAHLTFGRSGRAWILLRVLLRHWGMTVCGPCPPPCIATQTRANAAAVSQIQCWQRLFRVQNLEGFEGVWSSEPRGIRRSLEFRTSQGGSICACLCSNARRASMFRVQNLEGFEGVWSCHKNLEGFVCLRRIFCLDTWPALVFVRLGANLLACKDSSDKP